MDELHTRPRRRPETTRGQDLSRLLEERWGQQKPGGSIFIVVLISSEVFPVAAALPQQGELQLPTLHLPHSWASV